MQSPVRAARSQDHGLVRGGAVADSSPEVLPGSQVAKAKAQTNQAAAQM